MAKIKQQLAETCIACRIWKLGEVGRYSVILNLSLLHQNIFSRASARFHSQNFRFFVCFSNGIQFWWQDESENETRSIFLFFCLVFNSFYINSCEACDKHEFLGTVHTGLIETGTCWMIFFSFFLNDRWTEQKIKLSPA